MHNNVIVVGPTNRGSQADSALAERVPASSRMLGRRLRKVVLTVHVISAVGWIGAACAYLSLTVAALTSESDDTVRAAFIAMELVYFALIPLAATALVTGVAQALGTNWGLLRHYWIVAKLLLTVVAFGVMVNNLGEVSSHADHVRHAPGADLPSGAATHGLEHAGVGVLILLLVATLGLYKPRGLTRYGRRKQDQVRAKREEGGRRGHRPRT
jgi:hypothetical protein